MYNSLENYYSCISNYNYMLNKGECIPSLDRLLISVSYKEINIENLIMNLLILEMACNYKFNYRLKRHSSNKMKENEVSGDIFVEMSKQDIWLCLEKLNVILGPNQKSIFFSSWKSKTTVHGCVDNLDLLLELTNNIKMGYVSKKEIKANIYLYF